MRFLRLLAASPLALLVSSALHASEPAHGADISWLSQMESSGRSFKTKAGASTDCVALLKELGMDSIRLRVWVNPSSQWSGQADMVALAKRASAAGLRLMVDFHYSDTWADPAHQTKPAAWSAFNLEQLRNALSSHTTTVLQALKDQGITPEWVQIGNETNNGMLWNEGMASSDMAAFASLITAGNDAAKGVFPSVKTVVHISNGHDNGLFRWIFDGLRTHNARYDVIGMSLYPEPGDWPVLNAKCLANMQDMISRYSKPVIVSEVGMGVGYAANAKAFLADLLGKVRSLPNDQGLGVFYWEPQAYADWQGYKKGAFDSTGKPTVAMDAFAAYPAGTDGDRMVNISTRSYVGTGDQVQVAGFYISGSRPRTVLIRASGPTLADFGVSGTLADPKIELNEQATGQIIATNDNWGDNAAQATLARAAASATYAFPLNEASKDAALVLTLAPGGYTATVKGANGETGVCLIEVFDANP